MSPIQIVALAVRLFAVWVALYWARWMPYSFAQARASDGGMVMFAVLAVVGVLAVLGMWFFPRTIARSILPATEASPGPIAVPTTWLAVGCVLLGLWVLTAAVPALAQNVFLLFYAKRENASLPEGWGAGMVYIVVEFAVAAWLLLGSVGLRKLFRWVRDGDAAP